MTRPLTISSLWRRLFILPFTRLEFRIQKPQKYHTPFPLPFQVLSLGIIVTIFVYDIIDMIINFNIVDESSVTLYSISNGDDILISQGLRGSGPVVVWQENRKASGVGLRKPEMTR